MESVKNWLINNIPWLVPLGTILLCVLLMLLGVRANDGSYTLNGEPAQIPESAKEWMEDSRAALYRVMNEDAPTDEETVTENNGEEIGKGFYTTIDDVLGRMLPDGYNEDGGWQCTRYTGWLGTGQWSYSSAHPDYGPRNGKDMAQYLVDYYGYKYIDKPVRGAIGSGGFDTLYGHTALFLEWVDGNTALVNDANYIPLTVSTHTMDVSGWVWVVPGSYEPEPEPTPPAPDPAPEPAVSTCDRWTLQWGDTLGGIMLACEGKVEWGEAMRQYASSWVDESTGASVLDGWSTYPGVGLHSGHTIVRK